VHRVVTIFGAVDNWFLAGVSDQMAAYIPAADVDMLHFLYQLLRSP